MTREFPRTPATTIRRHPERGTYDRAAAFAILDEALVCHVGFVADGRPFVIPTLHARVGESLYVHGAGPSRYLAAMDEADVCVTVTLLDGLVLARSAFAHSLNYRSVVVLGRGRIVTDAGEKRRALHALVERVGRGRADEVRAPSPQELDATTVVAVPLEQVSAKQRSGPPKDKPSDLAVDAWAGVIPLALVAGAPIPDEHVPPGRAVRGAER